MRLARDVIPGVSDRYINYNPARLREDLISYSPLRIISQKRTAQAGEYMVETGEGGTLSYRTIQTLIKERRALGVESREVI